MRVPRLAHDPSVPRSIGVLLGSARFTEYDAVDIVEQRVESFICLE